MKTLIELFEQSVEKFPENPLMWEKVGGKYISYSYCQIKEEVYNFGAGLISIGIQKGDRIGLIAEGRTDWLVGELGMFYAGAINVPLSVKLDAGSEITFRLKHSGARMVIASWTQVEKVEAIRKDVPDLEKIIYLDKIDVPMEHRISFQSIKEAGKEFLSDPEKRAIFDQIRQNVQPNDLANISYTSGTTADPKGIMLSQYNYAENVRQANTLMDITQDYKTLTILPWDHSFAHTACLYCFMYNGASIAGQEIGKTAMETLRNIPKNINEIKPDLMMSVPALSKSFRKNIESSIRAKGKTAEKLFNQGLKVAYKYNADGFSRGKGLRIFLKPLYAFYDKIIFSKIRENFGGNLKFFIGGGALLDTELQRFFAAIGIPIMQGYGLSESSPVISSNALHAYKFGTSGKLVKHLELKICDNDGNELPKGEKGEMVVRGGNVMVGYWKNEKATAETIKDGWLYTGDMAYMDQDDFLVVLGRFKSLLISSDGEKFSPEGIEEAMVDQSPFIEQCMLYNNQNPYTSGMIVPNIAAINRTLEQKGIKPATEEGDKATLTLIQNEIDAYKSNGKYAGMFPERWLPATWVLLPDSFNEQNHLMNSTMKIVRGKIVDYFASELNFLYTPDAKNVLNEVNLTSLAQWNKVKVN
ncbi:MAG TPA: AMP-binding protein [Prolixibacteraceae bacterium]|nr:AMP-binding protein [Prolixibacteraceae bacterium]HPS11681.1 AMP-binding protein [Prolixibacteraceae bacterium]